jgi:NAD(P)-dependent dehydrogenase (short-subunit alcohol dehydrogenase family)
MNRVMIVTGGSRGIGAATALLAGARGYAVCVNYHKNRTAAETVVETIDRAGGRAVAVAADVASEAEVIHLFETVDQALGPVTALVNNAGILEQQMRVEEMSAAGAIDTMTIGLAQEVAAEGIRVNAVRPGFIYTDIHASSGEPNRVDRVKEFVPMKRGGQAEEVARAILWLLSDEASFSTGTFIDVTWGK